MTECTFCKEFLPSRGRNPILMKGLKLLANFRNVTSAFCHCRCAIIPKWHLVTELLGLPQLKRDCHGQFASAKQAPEEAVQIVSRKRQR